MSMLSKIRELLERGPQPAAESTVEGFERKQVALAALMVEASRLDTEFDVTERDTIQKLIKRRFNLDDDAANHLLEVAKKREDEVYHIWLFTEDIKSGFSDEERKDLIELLWEVAYADGEIHKYEDSLIRRVAELTYVSPEDCEAMRVQAMKEAGISG